MINALLLFLRLHGLTDIAASLGSGFEGGGRGADVKGMYACACVCEGGGVKGWDERRFRSR